MHMVYLWWHGTLNNSAAIRPFDPCHPYCLVCSNYFGAMSISWKIYWAVDGISHKSLHEYHSLHLSGFSLAGQFYYYYYLWNSWDHGFVVFHGNHKEHSACKAVPSRKESEFFWWSWSWITQNVRSRSRNFLFDSGSPIESFLTSRSLVRNPNSCLLKWYNFFWNLLKQRILAMYHDFQWLLVATKLLTAKLHSRYVKELESEILERSDILSPTDSATLLGDRWDILRYRNYLIRILWWSWNKVLMYFGGGYAERFYCILRNSWKNLRGRFGPSKRLKKHYDHLCIEKILIYILA